VHLSYIEVDIAHTRPNHEQVKEKGTLERLQERVTETIGEILEALGELVAPQPQLRPVRVRPRRQPPRRRR
jgi:hypothetical protein